LAVAGLREMFNHIKLRILLWLWRRNYLKEPKKLDVTLAIRRSKNLTQGASIGISLIGSGGSGTTIRR